MVQHNQPILVEENFLDSNLLQTFINFAQTTDRWEENGDGIWNSRSLNLHSMPSDTQELMLDYRIQVKNRLQEHFSATLPLYSDIFQFVRWRIGDELWPPHADAENSDGSPHPFPYRNFAAMTYLNTDFEGGQIVFPTHDNFQPEIKPGILVAFPGTLEYLHGVSKVTSGTRYTIAGFFTFDQRYHDGYRI